MNIKKKIEAACEYKEKKLHLTANDKASGMYRWKKKTQQ